MLFSLLLLPPPRFLPSWVLLVSTHPRVSFTPRDGRAALMCGDESLPRSSQSGGRSPPPPSAPWMDSSPLRMQRAPTPAGGGGCGLSEVHPSARPVRRSVPRPGSSLVRASFRGPRRLTLRLAQRSHSRLFGSACTTVICLIYVHPPKQRLQLFTAGRARALRRARAGPARLANIDVLT